MGKYKVLGAGDVFDTVDLYKRRHPFFYLHRIIILLLIAMALLLPWTSPGSVVSGYIAGLIVAGIFLEVLRYFAESTALVVGRFVKPVLTWCYESSDPEDAQMVHIYTDDRLDYVEKLRRKPGERGAPYFEFRKLEYVYCNSEQSFKLDYPVFGKLKEYERWKGHSATSRKAAEAAYLTSIKKFLQVTNIESTWADALWSSTFLIPIAAAVAAPLGSFFLFMGISRYRVSTGQTPLSIGQWPWGAKIFNFVVALAVAWARLAYDAVNRRSAYILQEREFRNEESKKSFLSTKGKAIRGDRLVPGDILSLRRKDENSQIPFDALVLRGKLSVDEVLFGEERDLVKFGISQLSEHAKGVELCLEWDSAERENHVLRAGSTITRVYGKESRVVVLKTGVATEKGQVVASALDEKVRTKQVLSDLLETFGVVSVVSFVPIIVYALANRARLNFYFFLAFLIMPKFSVLTLLTRDVRLTFVQRSLRRDKIACVNKEWILPAGVLNVCCFDKTGTLTKTSATSAVQLLEYVDGKAGSLLSTISAASDRTKLIVSCCHSLRRRDEKHSARKGDSIDVSMFYFANAKHLGSSSRDLTEKVLTCDNEEVNLKVLKPFTPTAGYMYVEAETSESRYLLLKGSPEEVKSRLRVAPQDYEQQANKLAQKYRVIALASKEFASDGEPRGEESCVDLEFNGFLCFKYCVDGSTKRTFSALRARHDLKILTGDHTLTAVHVAQQLEVVSDKRPLKLLALKSKGRPVLKSKSEYINPRVSDTKEAPDYSSTFFTSLVETWSSSKKVRDKRRRSDGTDEIKAIREVLENGEYAVAVTGEALCAVELNYPRLYQTLCNRAIIFGRVKPLQKASIVRTIRESGRGVLMCGDGLNDHPAFKASNVSVTVPSVPRIEASTKPKKDPSTLPIKALWNDWLRKVRSTIAIVLRNPQKLPGKKHMFECLEKISQILAEDHDVNADAKASERSLPIGHFRCGKAGVEDVLKIIEVGRLETAALVYQFNLAVAYYGIGLLLFWVFLDLKEAFYRGSGQAMVHMVFTGLVQLYAAIKWFKSPPDAKEALAYPPPEAFISQRNLAFVFSLTALHMLYGFCVGAVIKTYCKVSRDEQVQRFTCEGNCNFADAAVFVSVSVGTFNVVMGLVPYRHVDPKPIAMLRNVLIIWFTLFFLVRVILFKGLAPLTEPPMYAWIKVIALAAIFSAATWGLRESFHALSGSKMFELASVPRLPRVR